MSINKTNEFQDNKKALSFEWSYGFNKDLIGGVHSLTDNNRNALFYVAGHTGVIYDYKNRRQQILQGHCNPITSCICTEDKRWLVTADSGPDSMIVIWDSNNATPIKTIFDPHKNGVLAMCMSPDAMFLATLSQPSENGEPQEISLWEWTSDRDGPLYSAKCLNKTNQNFGIQTSICFNPNDIRQLMTNGIDRVIFWSWEMKELQKFSPPVSNKEFRRHIDPFTTSVFIPDSTQAVTATSGGDVVLWDKSSVDDGMLSSMSSNIFNKSAVKLVRLSDHGGISFIGVQGGYFITGSEDGAVRFYDFQFRLLAWYEDLNGGPVTSVCFSDVFSPLTADMHGTFSIEDFIVGTRNALVIGCTAEMFEELLPEKRRGTLLVQGFNAPVRSVTSHPFLHNFAACCDSGAIQLWNYQTNRLLMIREFDASKHTPVCVSFDPHGKFLVIGFSDGSLTILDAESLADINPSFMVMNSTDKITMVKFSSDSTFMATADASHAVAIYRFMTVEKPRQSSSNNNNNDNNNNDTENTTNYNENENDETDEWVYLGKIYSHSAHITGLEFSLTAAGKPVLISISEDRYLAEYDLMESSVPKGILLVGSRYRLEQSAVPTSCLWHPYVPGSREDFIISANDEYKFKIWNANSKTCRQTVLCPTYGGPLNKLILLPNKSKGDAQHLVYSTHEKVIGVIKLELDGNSNKSMGLIAHPGVIEDISVGFDGSKLITAGGVDCAINIWKVDTVAIDLTETAGGKDIEPYFAFIDGGKGGDFYQEIINYFYYAQIRTQGENSTSPRKITDTIPITEVPNLMRALGYYPGEQEVENLKSEIKYNKFTQGDTSEEVHLNECLRLYVNHRPVFGIGKAQLDAAFKTLTKAKTDDKLKWNGLNGLSSVLTRFGEAMSEQELKACLHALVGDASVKREMKSEEFASDILGFEDYENEK